MNSIFPWLLWRRAAKKEQDRVDKMTEELGQNKVVAELAERDPEVKEALRILGVKPPPK